MQEIDTSCRGNRIIRIWRMRSAEETSIEEGGGKECEEEKSENENNEDVITVVKIHQRPLICDIWSI